MRVRRSRAAAVPLALCAAALVAGCGGGDGKGSAADTSPIVIGTSLPLTGEDSQLGVAVQQGYKAWEQVVNAQGGIKGRKVQVKILDDNDNQNTVISDYNALISQDKVDFVTGTFSTRLTLPAIGVAERHKLLYVDPAGGAPDVFDKQLERYFYIEPAPSYNFGLAFATYMAQLPAGKRPKQVAYVLTQDPFTSSTVQGMQTVLQKAGIKTALKATYPLGTKNFDSIASQVKQSGAEMVINAGGFDEETAFARALAKAGATPRVFYQSSSPIYADDYKAAVGVDNVEGVFYPAGYSPVLDTADNPEFNAAFKAKYHDTPGRLSAAAFASGQVIKAAVEAVGAKGIENQQLLADWLHANTVQTVFGPLKWDAAGVPQSTFAIGQWQGGKQQIVLPGALATSDHIQLCYRNC